MKYIVGKVGVANKDEEGNIIGGNGFAFHGVDVSQCRQSLHDDERQRLAIVHSSNINAEQENSMQGDVTFKRYDESSFPSISELMKTEDWTKEE